MRAVFDLKNAWKGFCNVFEGLFRERDIDQPVGEIPEPRAAAARVGFDGGTWMEQEIMGSAGIGRIARVGGQSANQHHGQNKLHTATMARKPYTSRAMRMILAAVLVAVPTFAFDLFDQAIRAGAED